MRTTSILSLLFLTSVSFAQETPQTPPAKTYDSPPVEWVLKDGEPIRLKFVDGNEATFKRSILKAEPLQIPFTIYENTCQPNNIGQTGAHKGQVLIFKVALVWSKHSDSSKIGKTLRRSFMPGAFDPVETTDFMPSSSFARMPEMRNTADFETIEMSDFSWIPGNTSPTPPETLHVVRWEGEQMLTNIETGTAENRPVQGYGGVDLVKKTDQSMSIVRIQSFLSTFGQAGFPFGDVTSLSIYNSKKELCQIAAKIDQGPLVRDFRRIQAERQETPIEMIYGVDSIFSLWQERSSFQIQILRPESFFSESTETENNTLKTTYKMLEIQ